MYEIITDSSANLTNELIDQFQIRVISLSYLIGGSEFLGYEKGKPQNLQSFYDRMRQGESATTAQISRESCREVFEEVLKDGHDLLYIGFSSALSGTYHTAAAAAQELCALYPDRRIETFDSRAASMGQGLLVYHALLKQRQGATFDEVKDWLEKNVLRLCHWFTVDDLKYLRRGGRISPATALVGTLMGIKPILHVDDEGRLVSVGKVRGRRQSVQELFRRMQATCENPREQVIFIGQGDCMDDANYLRELIVSELHVKDVVINYVDAVIGAHSGPGTLALFYLGSKR